MSERLPEAPWEKEWREYEEKHLERPSDRQQKAKCTKCWDVDIECYALPFIRKVRIVHFKSYRQKTLSRESIEECTFKRS